MDNGLHPSDADAGGDLHHGRAVHRQPGHENLELEKSWQDHHDFLLLPHLGGGSVSCTTKARFKRSLRYEYSYYRGSINGRCSK